MTIEFYCHVLLTERRKRNVFVFLFFLSVNYRSHWPKSFAINLESIWISANPKLHSLSSSFGFKTMPGFLSIQNSLIKLRTILPSSRRREVALIRQLLALKK